MKCEICGKETDGPVHTCMKPTELKPCWNPLCNGTAEALVSEIPHHGEPGSTFRYYIQCTKCGLRTRSEINWNQSVRDKINASWNTRAETKQSTTSTMIENNQLRTQLNEARAELDRFTGQRSDCAHAKHFTGTISGDCYICENERLVEALAIHKQATTAVTVERDSLRAEVERSEINFREICLLCGFDPSDGEGTTPEQVVTAVKDLKVELQQQLSTAVKALEKWVEYNQKPIPQTADEMEQAGEDFTEVWFLTEQTLSQLREK